VPRREVPVALAQPDAAAAAAADWRAAERG
jgi:hypothetical protein